MTKRRDTPPVRLERFAVDLVVPCFQEEAVLATSVAQLDRYMRACLADPALQIASYRLLLVDDGSRDATWEIISGLAAAHSDIVGVRLSRNFGHQNALLAGLSHVEADVAISLDADLQDDIGVIADMLRAYLAGHEIALGVRVDRTSDSLPKRLTANLYYRSLAALGMPVVRDHADFRLMSRPALEALLAFEEVNLYLRGLVPALGFSTVLIPYARKARLAGETKYTLAKMVRLAVDGVTSFSVVPLRLVAIFGVALFSATILAAVYVLVVRIFFPQDAVPGWASTVLPLVSLGGVQLLSIGILGEYVGKTYMEVKRRPRFIVETTTRHTKR